MNGVLGVALGHVGALSLLFTETVKQAVRKRPEWPVILEQMHHLGVRSLAIATVTALFTGMVLALQTSYSLAAYGAKLFVGDIVSLSLVRELGPVLASLMVGGRVGAGITAEIGSMKVTEQIDAMEASAVDPYKFLVATRVLACILMLPLLTLASDFCGIFMGWIANMLAEPISLRLFLESGFKNALFSDFIPPTLKTMVFGFIVGLVSCFQGMRTRGGTEGVGRSATSSVVLSSLFVVVADVLLVRLILTIWG